MSTSRHNRPGTRSDNPLSCVRHGVRWLLDRVPGCCVVCSANTSRHNLCDLCLEDLPRMPQSCTRCALPLSAGTVCGPCIINPPPWHAMISGAPYSTPCDTLISRLKFAGNKTIAPALGALLIDAIENSSSPSAFAHLNSGTTSVPDIIIPMPLHWRRLWRRGFNQSTLIAQNVSRHFGIPIGHALSRHRHTRAQIQLDTRRRALNVHNAFRATEAVAGKHIALLDDVVTTCATITAAAHELKNSGAASVRVWTCARAYRDNAAGLR